MVQQRFPQRAYAYSWASLLLIYPIIFFMTPARAVVLLWLPLLALWRWAAYRRPLPQTAYNGPILLLVLMLGVSVSITPDFPFSLPKIAGLLFGFAVFYVVADVAALSNRARWLTVGAFLLLAGGLILVGFINFYGPIAARLPSALHLDVNPNEVSGLLTYSWPLLLALALGRLRALQTAPAAERGLHIGLLCLLGVGLLIGGGILYLTLSRGGQLGCLVGAAFVVTLSTRRYRVPLLVFSLMMLLVAGVVLLQSGSVEMQANATFTASFEGRQVIWRHALRGIQDFPLTGMGINMFRRVLPALYPIEGIGAEVDLAHAHNHLLQAALDLGIPGLIGYLFLWIMSGWQLWRVWRHSADMQQQLLAVGLGGALLAHFVFGLTDAIALGAKPGFLLWMLFGLVASLGPLSIRPDSS